ncbi:hypothetical protein A9Q73_00025, partial [Bermanella sp. 47_1433_sub80_T6]
DIGPLAGYFLTRMQRKLGNINLVLSLASQQALLSYAWPGNVRELEHVLSRAALKANASEQPAEGLCVIEPLHLGLDVAMDANEAATPLVSVKMDNTKLIDLRNAIDLFQSDYIKSALARFDGNKSKTGKALGVDRSNFQRLLKRLGIG